MFPSGYTGTLVAPGKYFHLQNLKATYSHVAFVSWINNPEDAVDITQQRAAVHVSPDLATTQP